MTSLKHVNWTSQQALGYLSSEFKKGLELFFFFNIKNFLAVLGPHCGAQALSWLLRAEFSPVAECGGYSLGAV